MPNAVWEEDLPQARPGQARLVFLAEFFRTAHRYFYSPYTPLGSLFTSKGTRTWPIFGDENLTQNVSCFLGSLNIA